MRKFFVSAALLAFSAPAFADTLTEVTTKGVVLSIQGMEIPVNYTPDGKFTAMDGQVTGTWKIDGAKLCTTSSMQPEETCTEYPAGKVSGDSFDLEGAMGTVTVKIN
ncbi:MAG: hypothetical protein SGJ21_00745 [Alphaproteobacteria bacterium]|nr:hypothetical protein [Alphaproteobacteria bacterium]